MYCFFFLNDPAPTEIYPLSLPDALPISEEASRRGLLLLKAGVHSNCLRVLCPLVITDPELEEALDAWGEALEAVRSEEHTSELQSQSNLVCRLLLEKKKKLAAVVI